MKLLNCRGMACPQPVIRSRELVDAGTAELEVLVDNEPAAENVERFLRGRGYAVDRAKEATASGGLRPAPEREPLWERIP